MPYNLGDLGETENWNLTLKSSLHAYVRHVPQLMDMWKYRAQY